MAVVLDASALLTLFQQEPGADQVGQHVRDGVISSVNFTEVVAKLLENGMPEAMIREHLRSFELHTVSFDVEQAYVAGLLRTRTMAFGLSLGDRSCLALAMKLGAPVLTGDRRWRELDLGIVVQVFR